VSTPWASDSVVPASDWAGLGMFSKDWRIWRGSSWFESHLVQCFPSSEAIRPLSVDQLCCEAPLRGPFHWWAVLWPVASLCSWTDGFSFVTYSWMFLA
jgi:hypothetical protein